MDFKVEGAYGNVLTKSFQFIMLKYFRTKNSNKKPVMFLKMTFANFIHDALSRV